MMDNARGTIHRVCLTISQIVTTKVPFLLFSSSFDDLALSVGAPFYINIGWQMELSQYSVQDDSLCEALGHSVSNRKY